MRRERIGRIIGLWLEAHEKESDSDKYATDAATFLESIEAACYDAPARFEAIEAELDK